MVVILLRHKEEEEKERVLGFGLGLVSCLLPLALPLPTCEYLDTLGAIVRILHARIFNLVALVACESGSRQCWWVWEWTS